MSDKGLISEPLIANYSFINDDIVLSAIVTDNGKQYLGMFHLNNEEIDDESYINCIHTAVITMPIDKIDEFNKKNNKEVSKLLIKSSEKLTEINLEVAEKFKAFKSWVEGITEFGIESFRIQNEIEGLVRLQYPIAKPLMSFAVKHDKRLLGEFINYTQRECVNEGVNHIPSLIANLELIKTIEDSLTYVLSAGINWKAIINVYDKRSIASNKNSTEYEEYAQLFTDPDWRVREAVAGNPEAVRFKEYAQLFTDPNWYVRMAVAGNPKAIKLEEYAQLFTDFDWDVRRAVARNINATIFEEYARLFTDSNWAVRRAVAGNPEAVKFKEYVQLFTDLSLVVRMAVAGNPEAVRFKEYVQFFTYFDWGVRRAVAGNPEAVRFKEYAQLFTDPDWGVRRAVAGNLSAKKFKEYNNLFPEELTENKFLEEIITNPESMNYEEYKLLFTDPDWRVREAVAGNPEAVRFKEYVQLFTDDNWKVRLAVAGNSNARLLIN